jgi:glycosyltransferase involved in cell wall biosynthesis
MALGVPVVAHASSAIPETTGDGGLVWATSEPSTYAASIARVVDDRASRGLLLDAARHRYASEFAPEVLKARFLGALEPLGTFK